MDITHLAFRIRQRKRKRQARGQIAVKPEEDEVLLYSNRQLLRKTWATLATHCRAPVN